MTKLVMWLGGPDVIESPIFPEEFSCPGMTDEEWGTLLDTFHDEWDNIDVYLPLEVDE